MSDLLGPLIYLVLQSLKQHYQIIFHLEGACDISRILNKKIKVSGPAEE